MPDGLLVIDKPEGPTSHDVVARARRALGERRIGHTGTLDPLATGVLPLLLGRATRLAQFLTSDDKRYVAEIRLGAATTTYDRDGEVTATAVAGDGVSRDRLEAALASFRGTFAQMPPPYSAKKIGGVSAHRLARRGQMPPLAPVTVTVHELALVELTGADARIALRCSAGFYVRSLAHDLGGALGCGAHLRSLRRTAAGSIGLDAAVPLALLDEQPDAALAHVRPLSELLGTWPTARVTAEAVGKVRQGRTLEPPDYDLDATADAGDGWVRLMAPDGALAGLARRLPGALLHPRVVLV